MFIYYVSVNTEDADIGNLPIFQNLASLQEIKIKSKTFTNYKDCVDSAQKFITDSCIELNKKSPGYFVKPGVNPSFSEEVDSSNVGVPGTGVLDQWPEHELSRLYLLNPNHRDKSGIYLTKLIVSILSLPQQKEGN